MRRSAATPTRPAALTAATWPSCGRWAATHAAGRSARPASTSIASRAAPLADQQRAFAAQIALARELDKPLVIHSRAAEQQTLDQLAGEAQGVRVLMHCFSMPAQLSECLARGYLISFAGNVTYPSAGELAQAARLVPDDRLLVETDAPYLTPQPVRKHRNQPAFVMHTATFIAQLRGISVAALGELVERNARALFGW